MIGAMTTGATIVGEMMIDCDTAVGAEGTTVAVTGA